MNAARSRIQIHSTFLVYIISIGILSAWSVCICTLLALFIHELGHYIAGCMMGERIERIALTPFGGIMYCSEQRGRLKGLRGLVTALAGPIANYALILIVSSAHMREMIPEEILKQIVTANLAMLSINLLPALPLDGGQAVFCLGYYLFRISPLISVLTILGIAIGAALVCLAVFGFIRLGVLNCSLLIIGLYLIKHAHAHHRILMAENLYLIARERTERRGRILPVRFYAVEPDVPLRSLIAYMSDSRASVFLCSKAGKISFVCEQRICQEVLHNPTGLFSQLNQSL